MKKLLLILSTVMLSCTKPALSHSVRVITFAMDENGNYVQPTNTVMYLNGTKCVCFSDTIYGYNTNPTFNLDNVNDGDELHVVSFVNVGESIQYKTIRVYVDNRVVFNVSNVTNVNQIVKLR
jgi:hypothetical protein